MKNDVNKKVRIFLLIVALITVLASTKEIYDLRKKLKKTQLNNPSKIVNTNYVKEGNQLVLYKTYKIPIKKYQK